MPTLIYMDAPNKPAMLDYILSMPAEMKEAVRVAAFNERVPMAVWVRNAIAEKLKPKAPEESREP